MGKRIITQRRGRGSPTYKSPSFRYAGKICYPPQNKAGDKETVQGTIVDIIHSPGHNAPLAEIKANISSRSENVLIPAAANIKIGDKIIMASTAQSASQAQGQCILPLKEIEIGSPIFNIESSPGDGGKFVRGAGTSAKITAKFEDKVTVMLPSKKLRDFNPNCRATSGIISGGGKKEKPFITAGRKYLAMKARNRLYPRTAGVAMNAVDHPFGCGRGRHIGKPKTPPRFAPPGRNIGLLHARKTGKKR